MNGRRPHQRRWVVAWLAALMLSGLAPVAAPALLAQSFDDARDSIHVGRYESAIALLSRIPRSDSTWIDAQRELARTLAVVGRYDQAENVVRGATSAPGANELWTTLGEILIARGKRVPAESAWVRAIAEHASDSLTAAVDLAVLHYDRGDRDQAMKEFDRFIDVYNNHADQLTSQEFTAVAIACRYLGENDPQLFKDALKAFDRAIAADGENVEARIALGEMFLEKYNSVDAQKTFDDVLRENPSQPRALLDEAKRLRSDQEPGGDSLIARALAVNPNLIEVHILGARLLLDVEAYPQAQREIDRALAVNPASLDALGVAAAIKYVTGDQKGFEELRQRALALNPHDAEFYATMSIAASSLRLYSVAADFAQQGVAADAKNWSVREELGMNLLRLGRIAEGRQSLEAAFAGDPYNAWVKNTLDLLDTFKNYDEISSDHFQFMIEKDESGILSIYLKDLAERAYTTYQQRYHYTPTPPIRVEVYRSNTDFSVRTIGMGGLGALGVSFGNTLAFDSPAAKDAGPFNWGSVIWHELAHTFTLGLTDHRVPRWFSEGLSVYEEHHGQPGWGAHVTPDFLDAFREGKLVPVSRMNDGFMHPAYPEQVLFSYYQASLVCDLIERDGGPTALVAMLLAYKDGLNTEQVFQRVLHTDLKAFDVKFDAYMRTRFAGPLAATVEDSVKVDRSATPDELLKVADAHPKSFGVQLLVGQALAEQSLVDPAITVLERALTLFPEYGGDDSPYVLLAHLYETKGDVRKAAEMLSQMLPLNETDYKLRLDVARLREQTGDLKGAADALDQAMYINPFDIAIHQHLADLLRTTGDRVRAVRERQAVVALNPVDRTEALYQLALAYHEAGDDVLARKTVVRALEDAPDYVKAQELLLTIVDGAVKTP